MALPCVGLVFQGVCQCKAEIDHEQRSVSIYKWTSNLRENFQNGFPDRSEQKQKIVCRRHVLVPYELQMSSSINQP